MVKSGALYVAIGFVLTGASVHGTARLWLGIAVMAVGFLVNLLDD